MPISVMVSYGKGKAVCVHIIMAYREMGVLLCSFLTPPAACQGKQPLNRRLNVPQSQSGCYGEGINPLTLLRIE